VTGGLFGSPEIWLPVQEVFAIVLGSTVFFDSP